MLAGQLLLEGNDLGEVAEIVGASLSSVKRWKWAVEKGGLEALKAKPHPGPTPRLNAKQKRQLVKILLAGPRQAGYPNDWWTCRRVAEVVLRRFHVEYHPDHLGTILHDLGWTCQKPEQQAREADNAAIERWRKKDWPRIKRGLAVAATP
jgi:transposase